MNATPAADCGVTEPDAPRGDAEIIGEIMLLDTRYMVVALPEGDDARGCREHAGSLMRFEVAGRVCRLVPEPQPQTTAERADDPTELLTKRELQIAGLVALGRINKQIACDLNISEWTVSTHLRRIYSKLGIRTRAALACRCAFLLDRAQHAQRTGRWQ
jgi:DNA-binding CsgD family transcriptional regulator